MRIRVLDSIGEVAAGDWNALAGGSQPFVRHEFLHALEASGCVSAETGWQPCHLLLLDDERNTNVGAMPLYLKSHSRGEFVFDWAWASAYQRAGYDYYPKLLNAIPFTPVAGPAFPVCGTARRKAATPFPAAGRRGGTRRPAGSQFPALPVSDAGGRGLDEVQGHDAAHRLPVSLER